MKVQDETENCYLSLNTFLARKVFQLPNKHFLARKMLQLPENAIAKRNVRTVKIPLTNFIYYFWGFILF